MTQKNQTGSAMVVLLSALVIVIIGTLGFVFWQHYANDKDVAKSPAKESMQMDHTDHVMKFASKKHNISFEYPHDWKVTEEVTGDDADVYSSSVIIKDAAGKRVADLQTSPQLGGACGPEAPNQTVTNVVNDSVALKGVKNSYYSYSIVGDGGLYKVVYGLTEKKAEITTVQCPGMGVNYQYVVPVDNMVIGGVIFAQWLRDGVSPEFTSLDEATAYATSDEAKKIRTMITSLKIGD